MRDLGRILWRPVADSTRGRVNPAEAKEIRTTAVFYALVTAGLVRLAWGTAPGGSEAPWAAFLVVLIALIGLGYAFYRSEGKAAGRRSVLIVEDEDAARDTLRRVFEKWGWDVRHASCRDAALGQLADRPDLIVLDLMLPDSPGGGGGGGYEVLRRVRAAGLPSRVVVTTGAGDGPTKAAALEYRPDAVLDKPFKLWDLMKIVEQDGEKTP